MNSQLKWKFAFILFVIFLCAFGLVGMPELPKSWAGVKENLADRIKLGLDLKGGSHLVLQVQVDEAIGQRCDQTVDQLSKQLHDKNIIFGEMRRVDDTHILVRTVDPATSANFRDLVSNQFTDWSMAPAAGEVNGYLLTMKPSVVADLRRETMDQSLETITRRINALGLTEPTIAFTGRGDNEILVQLPGEGDPTRAKSVIQAGGQLELRRVADDQTYPSRSRCAGRAWRRSPSRHGNRSRQIGKRGTGAAPAGFLHSRSRPDRHRTGLARCYSHSQLEQSRPVSSELSALHRSGSAFRSVHRSERRPSHGHRARP